MLRAGPILGMASGRVSSCASRRPGEGQPPGSWSRRQRGLQHADPEKRLLWAMVPLRRDIPGREVPSRLGQEQGRWLPAPRGCPVSPRPQPPQRSAGTPHTCWDKSSQRVYCRTSGVCCSFYFLNKGHFSSCGAFLVFPPPARHGPGEAAGHSRAHAEHIPAGNGEEMVAEGGGHSSPAAPAVMGEGWEGLHRAQGRQRCPVCSATEPAQPCLHLPGTQGLWAGGCRHSRRF